MSLSTLSIAEIVGHGFDSFQIIQNICKYFTLKIEGIVKGGLVAGFSVLGGLIGSAFGGYRSALTGALAGSQVGEMFAQTIRQQDLATYISKLCRELKADLVKHFENFTTKLLAIYNGCIRDIDYMNKFLEQFMSLMQGFFAKHSISATIHH